jgi:uncharacterized protein (TIGR02145 family)
MKKTNLFLMMLVSLFMVVALSSCNKETSVPNSVEINGIKWAICNVNKPGTFAATKYDPGMLYQWNRKIGWSVTDPLVDSNGGTSWDTSVPEGSTWESSNDPCPNGWRVPTQTELQSLIDAGSVWQDASADLPAGRLFAGSLFLPAVGYRSPSNGKLNSSGSGGYYWCNQSIFDNDATGIVFNDGGWELENNEYKRDGFTVRCVSK